MANLMKTRNLVQVLGWAWFSYGLLFLAVAFSNTFGATLLHNGRPNPVLSGFRFWFQVLVYGLAVVSGYMLTRFKGWARITTQFTCAIYIFWFIQGGMRGFLLMLHNPKFPAAMRVFAAGSMLLVSFMWIAAFIACLVILNLRQVKSEFTNTSALNA